jgi:outer membrane biosynthesis protein TonB
MYSFLLKRALPFTLTFIFGALLGGLAGLFWTSEKKAESVLTTSTYEYGRRCRMRRHNLVAETKPLEILYKPNAAYPLKSAGSVRVNVTFGADGTVKEVSPLTSSLGERDQSLVPMKALWEAVESAAREIRFTPEKVDGVPVTVTREVEMTIESFSTAYH